MDKNIIKVNYTDEMEQSYIDYAMSVIVQRAIPDLRDGLKPVHRRILYAMNDLNLKPSGPYKKSARIVGDVLGKYHPHGDSSVYEAMVRLSQDFNTNHPLVKGQGNFGSIDGDPAAAMRYTEAKLENLSMTLLRGLDKDIVDFKQNFDNTLKEPEVLPSKFFNLLVNGSTGIAVGMSTNIPPHNLKEVNNGCKAYLNNPSISNKALLKYIKGPDFPTGGEIINKEEIPKIYETGSGRIRIRAKLELEDLKGGRKNIVITEIPYTFAGNKTRLIENIIELVNDRKLDELSDVRDESSKDGTRIVLEVKKGVNVEKLKLKLFNTTRLEDTVTVNFLSIFENKPVVLSLKEMIGHYSDFLLESYRREFSYDLRNLEKDQEIKLGLIRAYDLIDLIIEIIRGSKTKKDVFNCLVKGDTDPIKFKSKASRKTASSLNFSKIQAEAIMKMQLQQLVGLELDLLREELGKIEEKIAELKKLLGDRDSLVDYAIEELETIKKDFSRPRRTKISQIDEEEDYKEEIIVEDVYALIDRFNYIKVVDEQSYVRSNEETLESYSHIVKLKNTDNICYFADDGNFYQIKIEDLPVSKMKDRGLPLDNSLTILHLDSKENLAGRELLFTTKLGLVKRVDFEEFDTIRRQILATKLNDDDKLLDVSPIDEELKEIVLTTHNRRFIRFNIHEISKQKRNAMGVIGINLNQEDYLVKVELTGETELDKRNRGAKGALLDQLSF